VAGSAQSGEMRLALATQAVLFDFIYPKLNDCGRLPITFLRQLISGCLLRIALIQHALVRVLIPVRVRVLVWGDMTRIRIDVSAAAPVVDWRDVHGPARAVVYSLIGASEPELARELHDSGWRGSGLRPVGISPPLFMGTSPKHGAYTTSGSGSVWLGSPVPQIAAALLKGVAGRKELRWGALVLAVKGVELEWPPDYASGVAEFAAVSPVLVKKDSRYLMPGDEAYAERLAHNLRHKADVLGVPNDVDVEVLDAGPRRVFDVAGAKRAGASARLRVTAASVLLGALYECGVGLNTVQGFGWVR
jgi:CRISPR-associated endoribonuclease Cas6